MRWAQVLPCILPFTFNAPWWLCLLLAMLGGAGLGAAAGALKAYLNVNEVIACIMLNWISLYGVNMLLTTVKDTSTPYTKLLFNFNQKAMLPKLGLDQLFHNKYMTIGVPLAILMAILVWVILYQNKIRL